MKINDLILDPESPREWTKGFKLIVALLLTSTCLAVAVVFNGLLLWLVVSYTLDTLKALHL
jgi:hypothetical protein